MTISPDRLAALDDLTLHSGGHADFDQGHCAMEVVSWLADEGFTDAPVCASPVLRNFTMRLNDRWNDEQRQTLKPFLPRMIGTGDDGKDDARRRIAAEALCTDLLPPWLRMAGLDEHADRIADMAGASYTELRDALWKAREAGWAVRAAKVAEIKAKVRERLATKEPVADADAVAVAAAVAAADADAVADAVAAAVAAAVAVAVADAVADAVAAADADADAAAVAVAVADADASPNDRYWAAYNAARAYYRDHPLPVIQEAADLAEAQRGKALELLDRLIVAEES